MAEVARLKDEMAEAEAEEQALAEELDALLATLPNLPAADVPDGADEKSNLEVRRWSAASRTSPSRRRSISTSARRWA